MAHRNQHPFCVCLLTVITICLGLLAGTPGEAQSRSSRQRTPAERVSPMLLRQLGQMGESPADSARIPVIARASGDPAELLNSPLLRGSSGIRRLPLINGISARLSRDEIESLVASGVVEYVTLDAMIRPTQHRFAREVTLDASVDLAAIGADLVQERGFNGAGVVVALFDSGIGFHADLDRSRVLEAVDFTGDVPRRVPYNHDGFGHGTAMAGIIGASDNRPGGFYRGVAPEVRFVDLKVIGDDGVGSTSSLIAAIDWLVENRDRLGVRVASMSLGHPPMDSYRDDPLCKAVERLAQAGISTFVSAGNLGKTEEYSEIWGAITSPGNDPAAITISAMNTHGTAGHSDDTATTYASRGPTYVDGLFKPDLTAPGNGVPVPLAPGSWAGRQFRDRIVGDSARYITLSGSSVATAFAAGTAALMYQANPELNANAVKFLLFLTAIKLEQPHVLEQGNGLINVMASVDLASKIDVQTHRFTSPPTPAWKVDDEIVLPGGAFAYGNKVVFSPMIGRTGYWGLWGDGIDWYRDALGVSQVIWTDENVRSSQVIWTDQMIWTDQVIWTDEVIWTDR